MSQFWSAKKSGVVYPHPEPETKKVHRDVARPMTNRVTDLLGTKYPLVMGGMTGVGTPALAAAMSLAGGLGVFAIHNAGGKTDDEMVENGRRWIRETRALCGDKPFGVNLTILPAARPPPYERYAALIAEEKVHVMETAGSGGAQLEGIVKRAKAAGVICIHKCTSVRHAISAEKYGVDILSVDGFECGGHPGRDDVGNFVLLVSAAMQLKVPFIASGGVATGTQLAASLALGADGVNLGTRVCVTQECAWPESFKQRALESTEMDTIIVNRKLGDPTRYYRNKPLIEAAKIEEAATDFKIQDVFHLIAGVRGRDAEKKKDPELGAWTAGQSVGLINDVPTVDELVQNIMHEAYDTYDGRLSKMLGSKL